jgi:hypothetical protein
MMTMGPCFSSVMTDMALASNFAGAELTANAWLVHVLHGDGMASDYRVCAGETRHNHWQT